MYEWAKNDPTIEIVMRPHHLTFTMLVQTGSMSEADLDQFLEKWDALPNAAMDHEPDCGPTFAASDILITDGVSFIAEYLPMDKPLLFLERTTHSALTELGAVASQAAYRMKSVDDARSFVKKFQKDDYDPHAKRRELALAFLMPRPGSSATRILQEIREGLARESVIYGQQ
jgi:CDP-glycerol glycerophosphotransferase (TagB/SpsB family)